MFRRLHVTQILHLGVPTKSFMDAFGGFENVQAVRGIFGEKTEQVLRDLKVELIWFGYMGVDDSDGHLLVNQSYLNSGDREDIYLDIIHELFHVKQWMEGRELFDPKYDYVERPTEIEAYIYTVKEARRLGLSDKRICQYLKTEWMSDNDLKRLAKASGVTC